MVSRETEIFLAYNDQSKINRKIESSGTNGTHDIIKCPTVLFSDV